MKASISLEGLLQSILSAGIDAGLREVKLAREGKLKAKTAREFLYEL